MGVWVVWALMCVCDSSLNTPDRVLSCQFYLIERNAKAFNEFNRCCGKCLQRTTLMPLTTMTPTSDDNRSAHLYILDLPLTAARTWNFSSNYIYLLLLLQFSGSTPFNSTNTHTQTYIHDLLKRFNARAERPPLTTYCLLRCIEIYDADGPKWRSKSHGVRRAQEHRNYMGTNKSFVDFISAFRCCNNNISCQTERFAWHTRTRRITNVWRLFQTHFRTHVTRKCAPACMLTLRFISTLFGANVVLFLPSLRSEGCSP